MFKTFDPRKTLVVTAATVAALIGGGLALADDGGMRGGMGGHGHGHGMGGDMGGMMSKHLLSTANATDEQRTRIEQILAAARTDVDALRTAQHDERAKMVDLLAAPTIDAAAVEQLRAAQVARHDQISKRMTQAAIESAQVLSVEQRQAVAAKLKERGAAMQARMGKRGEGAASAAR